MHRLRLTPSADKSVRGLRGKPAAAWTRVEADLKAQGCRAGGYRLLGSDGPKASHRQSNPYELHYRVRCRASIHESL
jgi:hypothetical protein